eukprot:GHVP01069089.1.p1 GENE.GHVP01069089.1~~GHVP01069089.1.p1  ORF type:complete len:530 (+),score=83.63 GHVP01069089.1:58-1647(+)
MPECSSAYPALDLSLKQCGPACKITCTESNPKVTTKEPIGIFDIFKVGLGPSSSHTNGPMLACKNFLEQCERKGWSCKDITEIMVDLYGSFALTGKGHNTDLAIFCGLTGWLPSEIPVAQSRTIKEKVQKEKIIHLNSVKDITFDEDIHIVYHMDIELPEHPNGMKITAYVGPENPVEEQTYLSIGGGFIKTLEEFRADLSGEAKVKEETSKEIPFPFFKMKDLRRICRKNQLTIAEVMIQNEMALRNESREDIEKRIDHLWIVLEATLEAGLSTEGPMPGTNDPRNAAKLKRDLTSNFEQFITDHFAVLDWVALFARAISEENACGGRVVTAPTNGAAGTLPAVLAYYRRFFFRASALGVRTFLATAAAIGTLYKRNATIAGAEGGCQAEIGVACSMAAAGLAGVLGATLEEIEAAAETAMEHNLGMTCDPLDGLVQTPCIERNCVAAVHAITSTRLAMKCHSKRIVSLDSCITTMYVTGRDLDSKYRETSKGGLAVYARSAEQEDNDEETRAYTPRMLTTMRNPPIC